MDVQQAIDIGRGALWTVTIVSAPLLGTAMIVGVIMGVFQAMTSIQEMTLAFVPKIIMVTVVMLLSLPWMVTVLIDYFQEIMVLFEGGYLRP